RVRQQVSDSAQILGQRTQLVQRRCYLLLVVCRLGQVRADNQHRLGIHSRLCVITLLKAATTDRHDARFFVGQVHLVGIPWAGQRWLRLPAPGLFSRVPLGLPLGLLLLVVGLLPL